MKKENLIKKLKKIGSTLNDKNTFTIDTVDGQDTVEVTFNNDVVSFYAIACQHGQYVFIRNFSYFTRVANDLIRYKNSQ